MSATSARRLAWTLCAITWLAILASWVLGLLSIPEPRPSGQKTLGEIFVGGFADLAFATIGALIVSRHPRNAVGWISCAAPLAMALSIFTGEWGFYALFAEPGSLPGGLNMAWLTEWIWIPAMMVVNTLLLLFPDGRLPSSRWRVVPWLAGVGMVGVAFHEAFSPGDLSYFPLDNPHALGGAGKQLAEALGGSYALVNVAGVASAASAAMRLRRARGDERQQLKWLASGGIVLAFGIFATNVLVDSLMPTFAGLVVVAAAIGVGVLKYRLYEIDVVINRTLVYGALTASLAAIYLGSVLVLQLVLSGVTKGSGLPVAASTLAVAALFRPARGLIQDAVDRRFYRRKYDAARTLAAFGVRLRDEVDLDAVGSELCGVVGETVQPTHVSLWLRS
jgi:hypothetical protein